MQSAHFWVCLIHAKCHAMAVQKKREKKERPRDSKKNFKFHNIYIIFSCFNRMNLTNMKEYKTYFFKPVVRLKIDIELQRIFIVLFLIYWGWKKMQIFNCCRHRETKIRMKEKCFIFYLHLIFAYFFLFFPLWTVIKERARE